MRSQSLFQQRGQTMIQFALIAAIVILAAKMFGQDMVETFHDIVGFVIVLATT